MNENEKSRSVYGPESDSQCQSNKVTPGLSAFLPESKDSGKEQTQRKLAQISKDLETHLRALESHMKDYSERSEATKQAVTRLLTLLSQSTDQTVAAFLSIVDGLELLDRKARDYGPGNINAFGDLGVLVRMSDKIERLKNLYKSSATPQVESVDDTWIDIMNYAAIAIAYRRKQWPKN